MFDTIILLTGSVEEDALSTALLRQNPHLRLLPVQTRDELNAVEPRQLRRARLISFASSVIVPAHILSRLGYGAYNFHPGPPNYPGWAPSHFAVYDRATSFGVTAHVMLDKVDSGPIIAIDLFDVPVATSAESLEAMAYTRMARQFFALAKPFASSPDALPVLPVQWCGHKSTRRHCAELCNIPLDITRDELERRMAAFGDGRLGVKPTITLHGRQFRYGGAETAAAVETAEVAAQSQMVTTVPA